MAKRKTALDTNQLGFTFEPPLPACRAADLAGIDRVIAAGVAQILRDETRSRGEIAGAMTSLLDEEVTRFMLDAYASEARDNHNISAGRFMALIAATKRHDILDHVVRKIGAAILVGEEINTARAGHLRSRITQLKAELAAVEKHCRPIGRDHS